MIISPCISICKTDPSTGYCYGCGRSNEEKRLWKLEETTDDWKKENKVINRDDINDDLIFIYEELESYLDEGFVSDPDLSFEIELENVKTRLALDYQKRKLNETAVRLKEEEEHTDKDKNIIASLMLEIVEITENIKNLERSEVN